MTSKVVVKTEMIIFGHTVVTFNDGTTKVYDRSAGITPPQVGDIVGEPEEPKAEAPAEADVPVPVVTEAPVTEATPVPDTPAAQPTETQEGTKS